MSKKLFSFLSILCMVLVVLCLIFKSSVMTGSDSFIKVDKKALTLQEVDLTKVSKKNIEQNWSQKKQKVKGVLGKESPDKFAEWHSGIRTRPGADRPDYPTNYKVKELLKAKGLKSTRSLSLNKSAQTLNWHERGPGNVAGRTRSILVDPADPNYDTWIVGSVGGGVWKTTDAGQTWNELTKDLPNLATSTLAWAPNFPNYIYVGTGENFGVTAVDYIDGSGIWMTDDGGVSWLQIASVADNPDFDNVARMAVDPSNPMVLVAAVVPSSKHAFGTDPSSGIYRTTDGGTTWTKTYEAGAGIVEDLRANPLNFNIQFATINGASVIKSNDGGLTWTQSDQGINFTGSNAITGRMELAISEADTARIYISAEGGAAGSILYSSSDAGETWYPHINNLGNDIHWLAGQGWYDNTIGVNPYNADEVYVGGINLWQLDVNAIPDTSVAQIISVDQENTAGYWTFVSWGGGFAGGGLDLGSVFWGISPLNPSEYSSVEIRFGVGKMQKAHRFVQDGNNYIYRDYIDVNFEVWDVDNNQQLMISFRDHEDNGSFELEDRATDPDIDKEYLIIHTLPYAGVANADIAKTNGIVFHNSFSMWPEAPAGVGETDLSGVADGTIRINWGRILTRPIEAAVVTDGYGQFGGSPLGVHVDHHAIITVKTEESTQSFRLLNGNDGGIAYSDDGGASFTQTGDAFGDGLNGYNTSQFYGIDKMNGADRYIGGTQDNGSWFSPPDPDETSSWQHAPSGDGFEAEWNYRDPNLMLESSQFNSIHRSTNGGQSWTNISSLLPGNGPFFTKIAGSKQNPDLVFAISDAGVLRSENFGASWTVTPMPDGFNGSSSFAQIVISLANPQIVWTARNMTSVSPPYLSTNGGVSFDATNIYNDVTMGRISGLDTHPTDENIAYVLSSLRGVPKILRTTDLGQTWEDISGFGTNSSSSTGFPDVAVYSLLVMPHNTDILWAGTEIGIFESNDNGGTWVYADNGLPAVSVYEMIIVNDEVVLATHGRGVWSVAIPELDGYEPIAATLPPRFASLDGGGGGVISVNVILPSAYDSSFVIVDGNKTVSFGANTAAVDSSFDIAINVEELDTVSVSLLAYAGIQTLTNVPVNLIVFPLAEPINSFAENFNAGGEESFLLNGMQISTETGFSDAAIHSPHFYPDRTNLTALLKSPIIVASSNATVKYHDIAIIEPGNPGTVFGDAQFWDFVVVEGSRDNGATWIPLADGYDARADSTWEANYPNGQGDPSMFVSHEINLLDTFAADDIILVRFRLFADANTNGWGWAIDNINIQGGVVSVKSEELLPSVYSLSQNYPNPFNPTTQINYTLPKDSEVTLQVFNVLGQKVRDIIVGEMQKAGKYTVIWNGSDNLGTQVSSGLYFYRIIAGDFVKTHKMTLLK